MSDTESSGDGLEELQDILGANNDAENSDDGDSSGEEAEESLENQNKPNPEDWIKSEEEKRLEKLIFGDKETLISNLAKSAGEASEDRAAEEEGRAKKRKPAWHDSDDEDLQVGEVKRENRHTGPLDHLNKEKSYKEYLTKRYNNIVAPPKWADLDREVEEDSDEEILKTVGFLSHTTSASLAANNLQFKKLKDLNRATYAEGGITSIQFHPTSTVAMVAGDSGVATLYAIDGLKNEKLHNMKFNNFPITCAKLYNGGTEAIFGSVKKFFYTYDLMQAVETRHILPNKGQIITQLAKFEISPCGKFIAVVGRFGEVHILDLKSKELLHTFKQESPCTSLQFSLDSKKLFTHSQGSQVTIFDLRKQRIEHTFIDDGCISGKSLAISPNSHLLATGSKEGVVNVYNYQDVLASKAPQPQKIVYNLTTAITDVKFNHTSEILGICSEAVPGAVKLLHFPSGTVFANFPGFNGKLDRIRSVDFSPNSGFMALGSATKEVSLYRLKHFKNY